MIHIDSLTFTLLFYAVMFLALCIAILAIFLKSLYSVYAEIYERIGIIEVQKQDDTSQYITDEEWQELCRKYGFDWSVKPYHKITQNQAVNLLEYLKQRTS